VLTGGDHSQVAAGERPTQTESCGGGTLQWCA
jgi:hypothetical protein